MFAGKVPLSIVRTGTSPDFLVNSATLFPVSIMKNMNELSLGYEKEIPFVVSFVTRLITLTVVESLYPMLSTTFDKLLFRERKGEQICPFSK